MNHLKNISGNTSLSADLRKYAEVASNAYRFPVESIVMDVTIDNGTVLSQLNANALLDTGSGNEMGDPINRNYMKFLKQGQSSKYNY